MIPNFPDENRRQGACNRRGEIHNRRAGRGEGESASNPPLYKSRKTVAALAGLLILIAFYSWRHRRVQPAAWEMGPSRAETSASFGKIFEARKIHFEDVLEGLVGTVQGETLELAFGGQEEQMAACHVAVGDRVRRGEILFELDHERSGARRRQAQAALRRARDMATVGGATAEDVEEAQAAFDLADKDDQDTYITAPKSGSISAVHKRVGETVGRNEVVAVLVSDQDRFYVETGVPESRIDRVRRGQKARIRIEALGSSPALGEVTGVAREVSASGRTGGVHVSLPEAIQRALRPGLSASVEIVLYEADALVVPSSAYDADRKGIYVVGPDGVIRFRAVPLGYASRRFYEIPQGLEPGERIVLDIAQPGMREGQRLPPGEASVRYEDLLAREGGPSGP